MLPLSLFAYDGTGCAGMQEEFLTSVAHIKKKLRLDMDSASVRPRVSVSRMYLKGTWQMRILRERTPSGTHLGQERLGGPSASMGRMSPLR